jgi:uncharacterized membrane protein YjgN (DUF898 family)
MINASHIFLGENPLCEDLPYEERVKRYTLEELEDIAAHINREQYPERYEVLLSEIALWAGPHPDDIPGESSSRSRSADHEIPHGSTELPFEFTGKAGEYFRIWIVNIALTVLTLGIYSAWAKVRKNRYIYGSTLLQGVPFEYLADPVRILIGRIIVFGLFALLMVVTYFALPMFFLLWPLGAIVFPWIIIRALTFKARNSAYRNIRFNFKARYRSAAGVFLGWAILVSFSFGLLYPYFVFRKKRFVVEHASFGQTELSFMAGAGQFYAPYIIAGLIAFIGGMIAVVVLIPLMQGIYYESPDASVNPFIGYIPTLVMYLFVYMPAFVYVRTKITNIFWSHTYIGNSLLECNLETPNMIYLYLTNAVAIIFSLGLLIPWATIRMTRYKLERLKLHAVEDLESFTAGEQQQISATGEEISEFFDFDIGL